ncbi:hypothetical protein WJ89_27390 [Burkholderia ubonensis]|nr:hypothetical protein WI76_30925 [Burkholderia ubonensis]KVP36341.1 hypothetical protein WJ89_27390 [Burkholderia ubonensis]KVP92196.1 hypothetical protein WJ97_21005 [Burkholderia ubonensis]KVR05785.1 hypothetical protein WK12_02895 [Burkholderia ubonensis]KWD30677.1 hypothetical protein WL63_25290 [Burkholderia ubonensis]
MRNLSDILVWIRSLYGIVSDAVCFFSASEGFAERFSGGVAAFWKLIADLPGFYGLCFAINWVSAHLRYFLVGAASVFVAECNGRFIFISSLFGFVQ